MEETFVMIKPDGVQSGLVGEISRRFEKKARLSTNSIEMEQAFVMINPNGVQSGLFREIIDRLEKKGFPLKGNAAKHEIRDDNAFDMSKKNEALNPEDEESFYLLDIDDIEVSGYVNVKEEIHFKTIIWEVINKEDLEEQAIEEAAAASVYKKLF